MPLPGSEPVPDSVNGPPLPVVPTDPGLLKREDDYVRAVTNAQQRWERQGFSDAEIDAKSAELKRQMLGDD